jgi:hypothetical protein
MVVSLQWSERIMAMGTSPVAMAEEYLSALRRKDLAGIAKLMHPYVQLKSPVAEVTSKEEFLKTCEKAFTMLEDIKIRAKFGNEEHAMIVYDYVLRLPIGLTRTASLITVQDKLIRTIELFFDARPFEKKHKEGEAKSEPHAAPVQSR